MQKSRKISLIFLSAALLFCASFPLSSQSNSFNAVHSKAAHNVIWEDNLEKQVAFLADTICQGRASGTRGIVEAGFWTASEFCKYGLLPLGGREDCCGSSYAKHCLLDNGRFGHNIVALLPGSTKSPRNTYIIVGAHYDHLGIIRETLYPGADSNASGTVAMLSLARMFSTMKMLGKSYNSSIIFVAFDAKELSMGGSRAFWKELENEHMTDPLTGEAITPDKIKLMVNIDQIGGVSQPVHKGREDYLIMLGNNSLPKQNRGLASYCNNLYDTNLDLNFDYYGSPRFTELFYKLSDQRVFIENGKAAVLFTSGITMRNNKSSDTADTLDYNILKKRIIFIFHWLEKIL